MVAVSVRRDFVVPVPDIAIAMPGFLGDAETPLPAKRFRNLIVGEGNGAAFTTCNVLDRVEAEAGRMTEAPDPPPLVRGSQRVCRIFDNLQPVLFGQGEQPVHVAGIAAVMHRHDRLGPCRDPALHVVDVDQNIVFARLAEHRRRASRDNRLNARGKRDRRHDHFVTRTRTDACQSDVQRRASAVDCNNMPTAKVVLQRVLERERGRAHAEPTRLEDFANGGEFLVPQGRTRH